jgi:predicted nucleic acid-binding protein
LILYGDTSALAKLVIPEEGRSAILEAIGRAERTVTSELAYVELRAAVGAAWRAGRLGSATISAVAREIELVWAKVAAVAPTQELIQSAGDASDRHALRAYDALHLATLSTQPTADTSLACWDKDLRRAAGELGYRLIPETID